MLVLWATPLPRVMLQMWHQDSRLSPLRQPKGHLTGHRQCGSSWQPQLGWDVSLELRQELAADGRSTAVHPEAYTNLPRCSD